MMGSFSAVRDSPKKLEELEPELELESESESESSLSGETEGISSISPSRVKGSWGRAAQWDKRTRE